MYFHNCHFHSIANLICCSILNILRYVVSWSLSHILILNSALYYIWFWILTIVQVYTVNTVYFCHLVLWNIIYFKYLSLHIFLTKTTKKCYCLKKNIKTNKMVFSIEPKHCPFSLIFLCNTQTGIIIRKLSSRTLLGSWYMYMF